MVDKVAKIKIGSDDTGLKTSVTETRKFVEKEFDKISDAAKKESKEVSEAFRKMGVRNDASIKKSSANARSEFIKIKRSGIASFAEIRRAHDAMTRKIKRNNELLLVGSKKLTKSNSLLAKGLAPIAAAYALIRLGTRVITESIQFESALLDLQKVLGDTEGIASDYTDQIDALAKQFGVSAIEVLKGTAIFRQSGFDINEAFKLQAATLNLVINGNLEAAEAAELLKRTLKGFKFDASEAVRITDVLNEISNKYGTTLGELAIGLADISPIAKKAGLSFEETAAFIAPIIEVFGSGSEAAQAFKTGLLRLAVETAPVTEKLKQLGIDQREGINKEFRLARDIIFDVAKAFETMEESSKLNTAGILAGKLQAGKMTEVFDGLSLSSEILAVAMAASGSAAKETSIQLSGSQTRLDRFLVALSSVARTVGNDLKPAFNTLLGLLTEILPVVSTISNALRRASLESQRFFFVAVKAANKFLVSLRLGKDQSLLYADAIAKLDADIANIGKTFSTDLEKKLREQKQNTSLIQSTKDLADARKASNKVREAEIELQNERDKQAVLNKAAEIAAITETKEQQELLNEEIEKSITKQKSLLSDLQKELEKAQSARATLEKRIAEARKTAEQQGLTPEEKLADNLERAADNLQKAKGALKFDKDAKAAREFADGIGAAIAAVLELGEKADSGLSREAESLLSNLERFDKKLRKALTENVETETGKLEGLKDDLDAGKVKLKDVETALKALIKEAIILNALIKEPITKEVTINITEKRTSSVGTSSGGSGGTSSGAGFIGPVRRHTGGSIPGPSGREVPAILKSREFVIQEQAVDHFGLVATRAYNRMDRPALLNALQADKVQSFHEGGAVTAQSTGPSDTVNLNLMTDQNTHQATMNREDADGLIQDINRINILQGRRKSLV